MRSKETSRTTKSTALVGLLAASLFVSGSARAIEPEFENVKVQPGDTLWSLSRKWLKDPKQWDEILKYNKLPSSDPTVALPGVILRVPKKLLKQDAATLVQLINNVLYRKRQTPRWIGAKKDQLLLNKDTLRTKANSRAQVRFISGHSLQLDPNSMAILKAPKTADHDLFLNRGTVHGTKARIRTPSALVIPKMAGTQYTATIMDDLSTKVQVQKGSADVRDIKGQKTVNVPAGYGTVVAPDQAPGLPVKTPALIGGNLPRISGVVVAAQSASKLRVGQSKVNAPAAASADLLKDLKDLSVGLPVAAYHIQIAPNKSFRQRELLFDKSFDAFQVIDLSKVQIGEGRYFIRAAIVDLLGEKGKFSNPRPYGGAPSGGRGGAAERAAAGGASLKVTRPATAAVRARSSRYRIIGKVSPDNSLRINGDRVPKDEEGNFAYAVTLKRGDNEYRIEASDLRGNVESVRRTITFTP